MFLVNRPHALRLGLVENGGVCTEAEQRRRKWGGTERRRSSMEGTVAAPKAGGQRKRRLERPGSLQTPARVSCGKASSLLPRGMLASPGDSDSCGKGPLGADDEQFGIELKKKVIIIQLTEIPFQLQPKVGG